MLFTDVWALFLLFFYAPILHSLCMIYELWMYFELDMRQGKGTSASALKSFAHAVKCRRTFIHFAISALTHSHRCRAGRREGEYVAGGQLLLHVYLLAKERLFQCWTFIFGCVSFAYNRSTSSDGGGGCAKKEPTKTRFICYSCS